MARIKNIMKLVFISVLCITVIVLYKISDHTMMVKAAEEATERRILFISSYSESFITVPAQIKGLESVFVEKNVKLEIEYMDTKRFTAPENIQNFYESIKYKINNGPQYDAIIVADDAALQFALDYQEELFSCLKTPCESIAVI
ncbi:MAG: hypothetical protein HGA25_07950 [Clostridiales bacterium]|nr:hypothetical protein [Clostridiales bacterium]